MEDLTITPDGEGAFSDIEGDHVEGKMVGIAGLSNATWKGKPTVAVRVELPDGRTVIAQTTLALFLSAADALKARHGDPRR